MLCTFDNTPFYFLFWVWWCSYTIFLAQILLIRPWPKAQPTINICRGWVKELSLSELTRSNTWTILLQEQEHQDGYLTEDFISSVFHTFLRPPLWGTPLHYIALSFLSEPYTCWSSKPLLEHLSHQTPHHFLVSCSGQGSTVQGSFPH